MARIIPTTIATLLLALGATTATADTLLLDGIEQDKQSADARPKAGMNMARVEQTYGVPSERRGPVGDPPITRWDYPDFSVYFEHELVIHAVARH